MRGNQFDSAHYCQASWERPPINLVHCCTQSLLIGCWSIQRANGKYSWATNYHPSNLEISLVAIQFLHKTVHTCQDDDNVNDNEAIRQDKPQKEAPSASETRKRPQIRDQKEATSGETPERGSNPRLQIGPGFRNQGKYLVADLAP